jgi:hypothetical protein
MIKLTGGPHDGMNVTELVFAGVRLFSVYDKRTKTLSVYERRTEHSPFEYWTESKGNTLNTILFVLG